MNIASMWGSHDGTFCFFDGKNFRILELEKFNSKRNCSFSRHIDSKPTASDSEIEEYLDYIKTTELDAVLIEGRKFIQKCDLL